MAEVMQDCMSTDSPASPDLPQSSTPHPVTLDITPPEVVVPAEKVAAKKPRKPRPPKIVAKLATVAENSIPSPSTDPSKEPQLPLEFWTGLMQTQKVIMAKRKSDHYNSFRIV